MSPSVLTQLPSVAGGIAYIEQSPFGFLQCWQGIRNSMLCSLPPQDSGEQEESSAEDRGATDEAGGSGYR